MPAAAACLPLVFVRLCVSVYECGVQKDSHTYPYMYGYVFMLCLIICLRLTR